MSQIEIPEVATLFAKLAQLRAKSIPFDGTLLRSVGTRYANEADFLSGEGAAKTGGRWNGRGIRAVYGSLDVITATREAYQNFLDYGLPLAGVRPRVMAGIRVNLQVVCVFTLRSIRRKIGFSRQELLEEDWHDLQRQGEESWTQAIGRGCRTAGFEAIKVPSARHAGGVNFVVFPECLQAGSSLKPLAADDLPPHPDAWSPWNAFLHAILLA